MSALSAQIRAIVIERAGRRSEYCRLPLAGQVATFPVDHVIPRSAQGASDLSNLALSCPHCNAFKWAHTDAEDPETGQLVELYNPRRQLWREHFQRSVGNPVELVGITRLGRATIRRLKMNSETMLLIRRLLSQVGLTLTDDADP